MDWSAVGQSALSSGMDTGGSLWSSAIQSVPNKANFRENRSWEAYRADNAHQREVADLRAAGLNPILSATGGRGLDAGNAGQPPVMPAVQSGKMDYSAIAQLNQNKPLIAAQAGLAVEQAHQANSAAAVNKAVEAKTGIDQIKSAQDTKTSSAQEALLKQQLIKASYDSAIAKAQAGKADIFGAIYEKIKSGMQSYHSATSLDQAEKFWNSKIFKFIPDTTDQWRVNPQLQPSR